MGTLDLDELLPIVAQRVAAVFAATRCNLYGSVAGPNGPQVIASWAQQDDRGAVSTQVDTMVGDKKTPGSNAPDVAISTSARLGGRVTPDRAAESTKPSIRGPIHVLQSPLAVDGDVLGAIEVLRRGKGFAAGEKQLLRQLASPVAVAIRNARLYCAVRERNRRLSALVESTRTISSTLLLEDVLATVAEEVGEALLPSRVEILEYDAGREALLPRAAYPAAGDSRTPGGVEQEPAERSRDPSIIRGRVPVAERISDPALSPASKRRMERLGEKACLNIPLVYADDLVGLLLLVETHGDRVYSSEEIEAACALGEQAAVAVHNARRYHEMEAAYAQLEHQLRDRHELLRLSQTLLTTLDRQVVFEQIALLLAALFDYDALDIALMDHAAGRLVVDFAVDATGDHTLGFSVPLGCGVVGAVAETGRPEMVNDMLHDPRAVSAPGTDSRPQASILVPLVVEESVLGVLTVDRFDGRVFGQREFELVHLVTNLGAVALRNAELYGEMQSRATTDALTGLFNRGALDERLEDELAKARRYGTPVSLLMIDIDDFKPFNDRYGHACGDRVLVHLAEVLSRSTRERVDVVARYGGEEFVVVLPSTASGGALAAADRLRESLCIDEEHSGAAVAERIRYAVARDGVPGTGDPPATVTVSVGVAAYPEHADSLERLLANADKALYLAKGLGKNRVEVYR